MQNYCAEIKIRAERRGGEILKEMDLGIIPQYQTWDGSGSLVAFVVSLNLQRRHLNSSQKAFVALEVERLLAEEAKKRQLSTLKQYAVSQNFEQRDETESLFDELPAIPRQLKPAEKAVITLEVEKQLANERKAAYQAAKLTGTNRQYVSDAKSIQKSSPEVAKAAKPAVKPGNPTGNNQHTPKEESFQPDNCKTEKSYGNNAESLTSVIARDHPETPKPNA